MVELGRLASRAETVTFIYGGEGKIDLRLSRGGSCSGKGLTSGGQRSLRALHQSLTETEILQRAIISLRYIMRSSGTA